MFFAWPSMYAYHYLHMYILNVCITKVLQSSALNMPVFSISFKNADPTTHKIDFMTQYLNIKFQTAVWETLC